MKTQTITFPDGYKVTITAERVTVTANGRSQWDKSIYFRPVNNPNIARKLRDKGVSPDDYLWNQSEMKPVLVRRGEGVEEAIAEATADERAEKAKADAERKAKWQAEIDADQALIAAAKAEAATFRALIPADSIEVECRVVGNLDGDECVEYWAEGVELKWKDLQFHGCGKAIRPRAQAAFFSEPVYSVSRSRLNEIKGIAEEKQSAEKAKWEAAEAARNAKFADAARTGQPVALESWTETRTVHGEGEFLFIVTEYALPDGSTKEEAINTY